MNSIQQLIAANKAKSLIPSIPSVPHIKAKKLMKLSNTRSSNVWYPIFQAALYCSSYSNRADLDWHSILLENRRQQRDEYDREQEQAFEAEVKGLRGNVVKYGKLPVTVLGGKSYYSRRDISVWIRRIQDASLLPALALH